MNLIGWTRLLAGLVLAGFALAGCQRTEVQQRGPRGMALFQVRKPAAVAVLDQINKIPPPEDAADPDSPMVPEAFKNVRVLTDIKATEFSRLMQALSTWVAPEQGCDFCHNPDKLKSDEKYTKQVARRMFEMVRYINTNWKDHVGSTGVTCWTCHRGQAVPSGDWFSDPNTPLRGMSAHQWQPGPNKAAGNSALPHDQLAQYLSGVDNDNVRVQGTTALKSGPQVSVQQARHTYSLMMYMAGSLGVNCDYCHNTRAFAKWPESAPQRVTAWYGIRMVRDLNSQFLSTVKPLLPPNRLSPEGDGPKVGCMTCHKGTFKPLYGVSMLKDYPELAGPTVAAAASAPASSASSAAPLALTAAATVAATSGATR